MDQARLMKQLNYYTPHVALGTLIGAILGHIWGDYWADTEMYMYIGMSVGLVLGVAVAFVTQRLSGNGRYYSIWLLSLLTFGLAVFSYFWIDQNDTALLYFMVLVGSLPFAYECGRVEFDGTLNSAAAAKSVSDDTTASKKKK
jgi:MFS family permease